MANVWVLFTTNLRVQDNTILDVACAWENIVFPLYYFDTNLKNETELWIRKIWKYRAKFLCESLDNLHQNLQKLWNGLDIISWDWLEILVKHIVSEKITKVYMQEPVWYYEIEEIKKLKPLLLKHSVSLYTVWDHTLIYKDDLPFHISDMPQVFTNFRKQVEKHSEILTPLSAPVKINSPIISKYWSLRLQDFWYSDFEVDVRRAIDFKWGEDSAWNRIDHYLWNTESLSSYKEMRNGMIWADYSSKLSPWLSLGCISARSVYSEVKKYEKQIKKNSSTYWLVFELLWRDFFQFIFYENPTKFFQNFPQTQNALLSEQQQRKFKKWQEGRTWLPFIDGNMKELALTGFMSNRGRQNVASYLLHDLELDWRMWAMHFENLLIDYDIASNWGNWAYQAWVWNDPRDNRYFNIEKQQSVYDSKGEYRKLWSI